MGRKLPLKIAVGPLLFGWPEARISDFYLELAELSEVDIIYLGEVVCSKRSISGVPWQIGLAEALQQKGKEVVLSTLAMPTTEAELQAIRDITDAAGDMGLSIEANDISAVAIASKRGVKFVAGPHLNIYSSGTVRHLCRQGAKRLLLPLEWPARDIPALLQDGSDQNTAIQDGSIQDSAVQVEYFAHGHLPLTFSARCYAARAHGLNKSECRHVCFMNPDGIRMNTLDAQEFATINGTQVMSFRPFSVLNQLASLSEYGVDILRISPQAEGTAQVIRKFQAVADGRQMADEALQELAGEDSVGSTFCNGYYYGKQGRVWIQGE